MTDVKQWVRPYKPADIKEIGEWDPITSLAFQYHGDLNTENIYCVVDAENRIMAYGYLMMDHVERGESITSLNSHIHSRDGGRNGELAYSLLMKQLIQRAKEINKVMPHQKVVLKSLTSIQDLEEMMLLQSHGFVKGEMERVMACSLTELKACTKIDENINLDMGWNKSFCDEAIYLEAMQRSGLGNHPTTLNHLKWMQLMPDWTIWTASSGGKLIGSVTTWSLSPVTSIIENVFVLPEWRGNGVARAMLTKACQQLKRQGKVDAILSVTANNKSALDLYSRLGFLPIDIDIEWQLLL